MPNGWRFAPAALALLVVGAVLPLWPLRAALAYIWQAWTSSPEYSHGIVLPFLTAFLIWQRRNVLSGLEFTGSWAGIATLALGCVLFVAGDLATLFILQELALWLILAGLVLALLGARAYRVVAVPIAFLLLALPLPNLLLTNLSAVLQLWSSQLGAGFLRLAGISVFLQGNVLDLGPYQLEVAEACSGLRYLFPLLTLGALMAYLYEGALWKRLLLLVSTLPLTVLMNSLRIGVIGILVDRWGPALAEGFVHDFQGWAVFMLTSAVLVGELIFLHRLGGDRRHWRAAFGFSRVPPPATGQRRIRILPTTFTVAVAMLAVLAALAAVLPKRAELVPAREAFAAFPDQLGPWFGRRVGMQQVYLDTLKLDDYLLADYHRGSEPPVNVYMAYYASQRAGEAVHSPRACLPGGGWQLHDFAAHRVAGVSISGQPLIVNRTVMSLGEERQLAYYWFQQRGRIGTNELAVKGLLFWDAITRHRTDGALVRLITPLPRVGGEAEGDRRLTALATEVSRDLPRYVPD